MVKRHRASKAQLVLVPVKANDGLLSEDFLVEQLYLARHSHLKPVEVLDAAVAGVMILINIQRSVSSHGSEKVAVLRQMAHTPNGRFVCKFLEPCVPLLWVVGLKIEYMEF